MALEIVNVIDRGIPDKEHVHLHVAQACNLEFFTLADTSYVAPGMISNKLRHHFWFPKQKADKGDQVVLVTGHGVNQIVQRNGYRTHIFYWQLGHSIWNDDGDTAVIFALDGWTSKKVLPRGLRLAA